MRVTIPLDLSTRPFIPLPRLIRTRTTTPLLTPSIVLLNQSCAHDFRSFLAHATSTAEKKLTCPLVQSSSFTIKALICTALSLSLLSVSLCLSLFLPLSLISHSLTHSITTHRTHTNMPVKGPRACRYHPQERHFQEEVSRRQAPVCSCV